MKTSRTTSPRSIFLMLAIVVLSLVALAACGGTEETEAGSSGDGSESGSLEPQTGETGEEVGELPVDDSPGGEIVEPGSYQPVAAMDDMIDPQPAPIDEIIVGGDGQSITVRYQNSYEPCSGARIGVIETDSTVEVQLETGLNPNAAAMSCLAGITGYEQTVILPSPIGEREVVWDQADQQAPIEEPGDLPAPTDELELPTPEEQASVIDGFVGMEVADAAAKADEQGRAFRVAELDGEPMMLTEDFRPNRINVTVENGIVQGGYLG